MKYILTLLLIAIMYIPQKCVDTFCKIDNEYSNKVWQLPTYIYYSNTFNFFNSIWLTDKEYKKLKRGIVKTKYRNKPLIIIKEGFGD